MADGGDMSVGIEHSVRIEEMGASRKRLHFTVPGGAVAERLESSMMMVMHDAAIPGFRPGRAPRRLVEKRFGSSVKGDTKNGIVSAAYSTAVREHKLAVVGEPEGNEELARLEIEPGREMSFYLDVEVMPEFELPVLEKIEIFKPMIEPTEQQIDEQIDRLKINDGELQSQERAGAGDYCIGHGVMKEVGNDKPLIDINGAVIQIPPADKAGKGAILGVLVDDFSKQAGLPAAGETISVKTKGPDNHENESVRGKDLVITFKVSRVERIIPAATDDVVKKYGFDSEAALRESVLRRLQQRAQIEQRMAMQQQVARYLLEKTSMVLPERLTARQSQRNLARARMDLMYRGMDETQIEERMAQLRRDTSVAAVRDLKLGFILSKAADAMEIGVTQDELIGRVTQIAQERGVRAEELLKQLSQQNQLPYLAQQIREHKALDRMMGSATVTELPLDEFNKKMSAA